GTIFQTIQMDMFLGGLLGAIIIAAAFHMITRKEREEGKGSTTRKLQERVSLLEGILLKYKIPTLKEDEVRRTAETLVPGFTTKQANLKDTDWEILLERGDKKAAVIMGAYTGEVKKIEHLEEKGLLSDPVRIIGIAMIIFLVAFSILNFRGFPTMLESVASFLGMSPEQFNMLIGNEDLPEGCVSASRLLMKHGISILGGAGSYSNENVKQIIESETGRDVVLMHQTDLGGEDYIISVTLPEGMDTSTMTNQEMLESSEICSSTEEMLCNCVKIPDINVPTGFIIAI
ncbi:MAG: hypothetical protein GTN39_05700, partial [Candidatus Aenigmarchaeota archaeon]|nr:hypothetical protein [Candidatus Aenigmarchaeota archaeon]